MKIGKLAEERIDGALVYDGGLLKVHRDRVRLPDGSEAYREYVKHPGAVLIVPLFGDGRVLLERQFRYAQRREFIEVPAGKREPGEPPLETAKRELLEETGYVASDWRHFGEIHTTIGYSDEDIQMYVARGLERRERKLDEGEFLELFEVTLDEAYAMIRDGRITDVKSVAALLRVKDSGL